MTQVGTSWLEGLEQRALDVLPLPVAQYVGCGARDSVTRDEAVDAWRRHRFAPRVLRDVTDVDLSVDVLGTRSPLAWALAPTSLQRAIHPDGELAVARATAAAGGLMVVSSNAGTRFAEIGATGVRWWLQAYLPRDRSLALPLIDNALAAGATGVVLTVDTPVVGTKYSDPPVVWDVVDPASVRVNFDPDYDDRPGAAKATDLGPGDIAWLRDRSGLPVIVKGVLRADDADRVVDAGAAAVWVSNHGGRQLDRALPTAVALPRVAHAVAGRVPVYVDGGLRSGLDLLTAYALGADLALVGRPASWALVGGEAGIARLHVELATELTEALMLTGSLNVREARGTLEPDEALRL